MAKRNKSYTVIAKGSKRFGERLKADRLAIVEVETNDFRIPLGMLISRDKHSANIGHLRRSATRNRPEDWEVVKIKFKDISTWKVMS